MSKKIIAFVGMPGNGKGTCTDYLASKGYPVIHFGNMVVNEVKNRGLEVNEANERIVREDMRVKEGVGVLAKRVSAEVTKLLEEADVVVLDGLYSWSEYKVLQKNFEDSLVVICVFTPRKVRYERLAKRSYRPLTNEEVARRDVAEIENLEKGGPIARADYCLVNTKTPEDLLKELDELMDEITADNHAAS